MNILRWPLAPPPLDIDFTAPPGRSRHFKFAGLALLVGGFVLAATAALEILALQERAEAAARRIDGLRRAVARPDRSGNAAPAAAAAEDSAAAWKIADAVRQPWAALLADLEAAARPQVALLSFEADARNNRTLRLTAEAASADDAFGYVRRLAESASITSASIVSHEEVSVGARELFSFTVALTWKGAA